MPQCEYEHAEGEVCQTLASWAFEVETDERTGISELEFSCSEHLGLRLSEDRHGYTVIPVVPSHHESKCSAYLGIPAASCDCGVLFEGATKQ